MTYGFVIGVLIIALIATLIGVIVQSNETNQSARRQEGSDATPGSEPVQVQSASDDSAELIGGVAPVGASLGGEQSVEVIEVVEVADPAAARYGDSGTDLAHVPAEATVADGNEVAGTDTSAREITTAELMAPITMAAAAIDDRQDEDNEAAEASISAPHMSAAGSEYADESSGTEYQNQTGAHHESDEGSTPTIVANDPQSESFENVSESPIEVTLDDQPLDTNRSERGSQTERDPDAIDTSAEPDFVLIPADPGSLESVIEVEPIADADLELNLDPEVHPAEDWIAAPENAFSEFVNNLPTGEPVDEGFSTEPEPIGHIDAGAADWELTPATSDESDDDDRTADSDMEGKADA